MPYLLEPVAEGNDLVVQGALAPDARDAVLDGLADGIWLNYARGYISSDLSVLRGLPIRRLKIIDRTLTDLSELYTLGSTLEVLQADVHPTARIDLSRLPHLTELITDWAQVKDTIGQAGALRRLYLGHFTEHELHALAHLSALEWAMFKDYPRVHSLAGIESFPHLEFLGVYLARYLTDISALASLPATNLQRLDIPSCGRLTNLEPLAGLTALEHLDAGDCKDLASAAPLTGLRELTWLDLYGSTTFLDGDLTPIAQLPNLQRLGMMNRRHYHPPVKDIQATISDRVREGER